VAHFREIVHETHADLDDGIVLEQLHQHIVHVRKRLETRQIEDEAAP